MIPRKAPEWVVRLWLKETYENGHKELMEQMNLYCQGDIHRYPKLQKFKGRFESRDVYNRQYGR